MSDISVKVTNIVGHEGFTLGKPIPAYIVYRMNRKVANEFEITPINFSEEEGTCYYFNQHLHAVYELNDTLASKRPFKVYATSRIYKDGEKVMGFMPKHSFVFKQITFNGERTTMPYVLFDDTPKGSFGHMFFPGIQDLYLYLAYLKRPDLVLSKASEKEALTAIAAHEVVEHHLNWK